MRHFQNIYKMGCQCGYLFFFFIKDTKYHLCKYCVICPMYFQSTISFNLINYISTVFLYFSCLLILRKVLFLSYYYMWKLLWYHYMSGLCFYFRSYCLYICSMKVFLDCQISILLISVILFMLRLITVLGEWLFAKIYCIFITFHYM